MAKSELNTFDDTIMCESCFNMYYEKITSRCQQAKCFEKRYDVFMTTDYCDNYSPKTVSNGREI